MTLEDQAHIGTGEQAVFDRRRTAFEVVGSVCMPISSIGGGIAFGAGHGVAGAVVGGLLGTGFWVLTKMRPRGHA